ncbi:MAG TPA: hypothetical protein DCL52_09135, partial [Flavobacteriaceae bacterium]|nr:hypothetical protein [Flavobacteriaceae bacterium]
IITRNLTPQSLKRNNLDFLSKETVEIQVLNLVMAKPEFAMMYIKNKECHFYKTDTKGLIIQ